MTNLIERLRNRIHDSHMDTERLIDESADEIERLREELATAINALRLIKAMPHSHEAIRTCVQTLDRLETK